jgi:Uncharacterized protein involved in cytokinesis, contains TGc (transglutaminase/protease-like) domain
MRFVLLLVLFGINAGINAQQNTDYSRIDNIALQIPDSSTRSTNGIARYILAHFSSETDKSRAIFIWVAKNIRYDIANMFIAKSYKDNKEIIDEVIRTRKGVCTHYAELFNAIAHKVGIKSYVISGYTKQNGVVDKLPHSWCASMIDSKWYFFDPTWGAGYIMNKKYVKQINNAYFKTKPEELIKSHIPFDPLWQFLNYPLTNQEFYDGKVSANKKKLFFNYRDTLRNYEQKSEIEKLISSNIRIEYNGVKNSMIYNHLKYNKQEIETIRNNSFIAKYNEAVSSYNDGVNRLNRFINYRNNRFTPQKSDNDIKQMIDTSDYYLSHAQKILKEIKSPDSQTAKAINQLNKSINEAMINLDEQKVFLNKYLKTGKSFRKALFR